MAIDINSRTVPGECMNIGIVIFDNFTDADFFLHWDLLSCVRLFNLQKNWTVKILGSSDSHLSASGLKVETTGLIDEAENCDAVLISSGFGTRDLISDVGYLKRLKIGPTNRIVAAQCSGSLVLGAKGMLRGVRVSGYPPILSYLNNYGAQSINESLVTDGKISTASSCLGSVLLSSYIIENLSGLGARSEIVKSICPISGFSDFANQCEKNMGDDCR